jgi:hypothetical protein
LITTGPGPKGNGKWGKPTGAVGSGSLEPGTDTNGAEYAGRQTARSTKAKKGMDVRILDGNRGVV